MGTIFSPSEALRTWDTDPLPILLLSFSLFPLPPSSRPRGILPRHIHTQGNGPSKIQAPGISEMATEQEITSAQCPRTGGPDESRGRADGTSATCARSPTCAPVLGV